MGMFKRLFGFTSTPAAAPSSRSHSQIASHSHSQSHPQQPGSRRELLRVVLRETLNRHGIPASWVSAEALVSTSRGGEKGVHWRLVVNHWEPRLLTHSIAFQQSLIKRVMTFDPLASNWLTGISWQFALPDESICPPMPHPGVWTSEPHQPWSAKPAESNAADGPSGDVIAGPVRIENPITAAQAEADQAKADLEQLLAVRDADYDRNGPGFDKTQPMYAATEPARL